MPAGYGVRSMLDRAALGAARAAARTGSPPHGEAVAPLCLDAASSLAPRPSSHRIFVVRCCLRWCLGLADAVCCAEVGEVRSGAHDRALPLGFFTVFDVFAQELLFPSLVTAIAFSVIHSAHVPPRPDGHSSGAPLGTRATVHLAGMQHRSGMRSGPVARTLGRSCTAISSSMRTGAPTGSDRVAAGTRIRLCPVAASPMSGIPRVPILVDVTRLPARGVAGSACGPASAEASSQRGEGGLGRRRIGGGGTSRRICTRRR